jgi:hypothetical protein
MDGFTRLCNAVEVRSGLELQSLRSKYASMGESEKVDLLKKDFTSWFSDMKKLNPDSTIRQIPAQFSKETHKTGVVFKAIKEGLEREPLSKKEVKAAVKVLVKLTDKLTDIEYQSVDCKELAEAYRFETDQDLFRLDVDHRDYNIRDWTLKVNSWVSKGFITEEQRDALFAEKDRYVEALLPAIRTGGSPRSAPPTEGGGSSAGALDRLSPVRPAGGSPRSNSPRTRKMRDQLESSSRLSRSPSPSSRSASRAGGEAPRKRSPLIPTE